MIKTIFFILIWLFPCKLSVQNPKFIALSSVNPSEKNFDDLAQLNTYFKNRKIIGIGEATHGTREFTLMRHRVFEYLVKKNKYNTIILEADFGACQGINRYINGHEKSGKKALNEIKLWPWRTKEMLSFIEWVKQYNSINEKKIEFIGCDMQLIVTDIKELENRVENITIKDSLEFFLKNRKSIFKNKESLTALTKKTIDETKDYKTKLIAKSILQNLKIPVKSEIYNIANYRDSCMAKNITDYIKYRPNTKAIFIAHNTHISQEFSPINSVTNRITTGWYLKQAFGNKYLSIAEEFYSGSFNATKKNKMRIFNLNKSKKGTLGSYFSKFNSKYLFSVQQWIPQEIVKMNNIGSGYGNGVNRYAPKSKFFDAFIFIRETTPTHFLD